MPRLTFRKHQEKSSRNFRRDRARLTWRCRSFAHRPTAKSREISIWCKDNRRFGSVCSDIRRRTKRLDEGEVRSRRKRHSIRTGGMIRRLFGEKTNLIIGCSRNRTIFDRRFLFQRRGNEHMSCSRDSHQSRCRDRRHTGKFRRGSDCKVSSPLDSFVQREKRTDTI